MENFVSLEAYLKDGKVIEYRREPQGWDYLIGSVSLDEYTFCKITSLDEFIDQLKSGRLVSYTDDFINIDDFIEDLKEQYGKDFTPDKEEDWYSYDCHKGKKNADSPMIVGASGHDTFLYWEEYHENKKQLMSFVNKLEKAGDQSVIKIDARVYDEEDGEVFTDQTYTIIF